MQAVRAAMSIDAVALKEQTLAQVATREARIGIIGLGHVGLPLALLFSQERLPVIGFDVDQNKILEEQHKAGQVPPLWDGHAAERIARIIAQSYGDKIHRIDTTHGNPLT